MCFFHFNCCCQNKKRNCNDNAYDNCYEYDKRPRNCECRKPEHDDNCNNHNRPNGGFYKCVTLCCTNVYYHNDDHKKEKCDCNRHNNNFWEF